MNNINMADGFAEVAPEELDDYKKVFQWRDKEGTIQFPFIYKNLTSLSRCIFLIPHNNIIKVENEIKTHVPINEDELEYII
tara:strand:+ start:188 stop:430 length:243 start_codon:yes stop_codon:yes gene_type:complete